MNTSYHPYRSKVITCLMRASGVLYQSQASSPERPSFLYRIWCYFWDVPHILYSLQIFVLYFYGLCDLFNLLFAVIPLNVVITRHRYKKWHEDGRGLAALRQPSQDIPLSEKEIKKWDFMIFAFLINTTSLAWLWASCTLSIPLLWIDSASAASLPFSLRVLAQCIEIFAWVSGPFGFFAFFNTSFVVAVTFYIKYHRLVIKTKALLDKFNRKNYDMKDDEMEIQSFVNECIPHHMEICRAMQKYSSSTSTSHFINVCGVIWLIGMCYVYAFVLNVHQDASLWWAIRPWTTLAFFTIAFFQVMMPFALLSSKTVEYVRLTEICLGTVAAYPLSGILDAQGNDIAETARRELKTFAIVQDNSYIRIMGTHIELETLVKYFYVLAVLFVLPLVTG